MRLFNSNLLLLLLFVAAVPAFVVGSSSISALATAAARYDELESINPWSSSLIFPIFVFVDVDTSVVAVMIVVSCFFCHGICCCCSCFSRRCLLSMPPVLRKVAAAEATFSFFQKTADEEVDTVIFENIKFTFSLEEEEEALLPWSSSLVSFLFLCSIFVSLVLEILTTFLLVAVVAAEEEFFSWWQYYLYYL